MFLAATKDKAFGWTKRQKAIMREHDRPFQQLADDLIDEFRSKIGKKKKSDGDKGTAHNTSSPGQKGKGKGKGGKPGCKPAFNDKGNNHQSSSATTTLLPLALKDLEAEQFFSCNVVGKAPRD